MKDDIQPYAAARECTPNEMVRRIVEATISGDLVVAVLDDDIKTDESLCAAARNAAPYTARGEGNGGSDG